MKHAREDYSHIQDNTTATELANLILSMNFATPQGITARQLARKILGIQDGTMNPPQAVITTNGTTRIIPADEPVFLIRGQDAVGGDAVRAWATLAEAAGAHFDICQVARQHAALMDQWPKKKLPDMPQEPTNGQ